MQAPGVVGSGEKLPLHCMQSPRVGCQAMQVGIKEFWDELTALLYEEASMHWFPNTTWLSEQQRPFTALLPSLQVMQIPEFGLKVPLTQLGGTLTQDWVLGFRYCPLPQVLGMTHWPFWSWY